MSRMWIVLEMVFLGAVVLLSITEFFYPIVAGKPLFGSFRKMPDEASSAKDGSDDQHRDMVE